MTTAVNLTGDAGVDARSVVDLVRWQPVSEPIDHGSGCCRAARRWLSGIHAGGSPTTPLSGLGWIAEMYPWGPSRWPMSWCKLVEQEKLDCGAQSAIARDVVNQSGSVALGVQLLIQADSSDIGRWGRVWRDEGVTPNWLFERLYYHEAVGVADATLSVFDPTRNWKVLPDERVGHGSVAAVRVSGSEAVTVGWGPHELAMGEWTILP